MAHFRGTVLGRGKTETSRLGTKESDLVVTANGWGFGVKVYLSYDDKNDEDVASIFLTRGSAPSSKEKHLGVFKRSDVGH